MVVAGDDLMEMMERTHATALKCRKCGAAFTFEQGGKAAIDAGKSGKLKCPSCGVIYDADVHPSGINLILDGHGEWFLTSDRPTKRHWRFWKR